MSAIIAVLLGVLIGVSLGALGGGGSILTVPALVYIIGEHAQAATTGSLVIVGVSSLIAAIGHARSHNVRWTVGTAFGVVGVVASFVGTALNRAVDPNVLLLAFAGLTLLAAAGMLRRSAASTRPDAEPDPEQAHARVDPAGDGRRSGEGVSSAVSVAPDRRTTATTTRRSRLTPIAAAKILLAGLAVGFLTGFLGVGGGFIIVPALVMALGFPMPVAVGTSLLIIALNSVEALVARTGHDTFHWAVIIPFTIAAVAGSLVGKRVADHVSGTSLSRAFAGLLIAVAAYVGIRSGIGLA